MKYFMFIKHAEMTGPVDVPKGLNDAMGEFVAAEFASGRLVDTNGLRPTREGKLIRSHGGKLTFTDGPFTEAKEVIGGYAIVNVTSAQEADEVATKFMEIHRLHWPEFDCTCEVRPIDEPPAA